VEGEYEMITTIKNEPLESNSKEKFSRVWHVKLG
jgi:hypothetical protein